jgi:hypothetical protein
VASAMVDANVTLCAGTIENPVGTPKPVVDCTSHGHPTLYDDYVRVNSSQAVGGAFSSDCSGGAGDTCYLHTDCP